ncbi:MAG: macrolide ABC transporter ATP-binding protein [Chloroflexi bacterium]|nr:macrolide ABC transporter ATP-binding protein [Chloroflexota bacterium]MBL75500.1 macrolide ABC transporter ATP-binding protein [Chloroflexota bacterium]MCH2531832.1 ABC transporter ATP-binding protein [Dehalococcoidia bacterium]|tara:strand:+ start:6777 stop:7463 length:687 start_codon:yes stop_codon:yes gene_type:complete
MNSIIEAKGVTKVYQTGDIQVNALNHVDLSIGKGQMVAVMGPSGSGKTTLLNIFSGIDDLTEGEVIIDGQPIHSMSDKEKTRYRAENMGFVFQAYNLLPVLTGAENVELPLLLAGKKPSVARKRALEVLDLVELSDQANKRPSQMSGGQQQRITVARALVNNPAIVWADEPTGALDSETGGLIIDLLCRLNEQTQQTFVLVTHDAVVGSRAQRMILMRDGQIESDETK